MVQLLSRPDRVRRLAPALLLVSAGVLLALTVPSQPDLVDFHVYVLGGAALEHPETLYSFVYTDQSPTQPLPFVYPPFAAILFYPLHFLPFAAVGLLWQVAMIAAMYAIVRVTQLMLGNGDAREAMLWTAGLIWLEPARISINLGQVGIFLTLAVLCAAYNRRWWVSGLLVGLAAGVKLTPAVTGLYFVGVRRWATAAFAATVFFATVALSWLVVGDQVPHYFTQVMGDTSINPIGIALNQSWRGGISRIVGHDAGEGALVLVAIAGTAIVAGLAWRALGDRNGARDQLGSLLVVELFGLLVSPISWVHHWIWVAPLIIWLWRGSWRDQPGARVLGWIWIALTFVSVPSILAMAEPSLWQISRPWYLAWAGLAYLVAAAATLVWMAVTGLRPWRSQPGHRRRHPHRRPTRPRPRR